MTTVQVILLGFWVYTAGVASNTHAAGSGRGFTGSTLSIMFLLALLSSILVYALGGA